MFELFFLHIYQCVCGVHVCMQMVNVSMIWPDFGVFRLCCKMIPNYFPNDICYIHHFISNISMFGLFFHLSISHVFYVQYLWGA